MEGGPESEDSCRAGLGQGSPWHRPRRIPVSRGEGRSRTCGVSAGRLGGSRCGLLQSMSMMDTTRCEWEERARPGKRLDEM